MSLQSRGPNLTCNGLSVTLVRPRHPQVSDGASSPLLGMAAASDQLAVWKCYQTVSAGGFRKVLRDGPPSQSVQACFSEGGDREQARVVAHRQAKVDWPCSRSTVICCTIVLSSMPAPIILRCSTDILERAQTASKFREVPEDRL